MPARLSLFEDDVGFFLSHRGCKIYRLVFLSFNTVGIWDLIILLLDTMP